MVEKKKKSSEWKVIGWIALAMALFLFVAFTVREGMKKHPPKALHTPLPQPAAETAEDADAASGASTKAPTEAED